MPLDLNEKINLFADYLNNGGAGRINHIDLLESLKEVKWDIYGKVIPETVNSLVRVAINAYTGSQLMEPYMSDKHLSRYETLLQKSLFFDTTKIDTFDDFLSIYNTYSKLERVLYRGLNEANYRLYSSLQLYWITNKMVETDINYKDFVTQLIKNARDDINIQKQLEGHVKSDLSILSILQHYESPTPLLDWTYSIQNALLFSLNGLNQRFEERRDIENYFSVYYIQEENYKDANLKIVLEESIEANLPLIKSTISKNLNLSDEALERFNKNTNDDVLHKLAKKSYAPGIQIDLTKTDKLFLLDILYFSDYDKELCFNFGLNNNPNIIAQQGAFTWNNNPTKPIEHMLNISLIENRIIKNPNQLSYCWDINKNLADKISNFLAENGYVYENLFPESTNTGMMLTCKSIFDKTLQEIKRE